MKVKDLTKRLKGIDQNKDIYLIVNNGNPEDASRDMYYDFVEVWDNSDAGVDMFIGLNQEEREV
jgi:hypothetical protein